MTLLAFVSTTCDGCVRLLAALREPEGRRLGGRVVVLVQGETNSIFEKHRAGGLEMHWIAHSPDVARDYGVNLVPLVYALSGRTVLGSRSAASVEELHALLFSAQEAQQALKPELASTSAT